MTRFSPLARQCCLDAMDSLMHHPISQQFIELGNCTQLEKEYDFKKQSLGLKYARDRLAMNKYTTISQWEKDVNTIFVLVKKLHPNNQFYRIVAEEMEALFKKYVEIHLRCRTSKWTAAVVHYDKKIEEILNFPPSLVIAHAPLDKTKDAYADKPISEEELNTFVRFSQYFKNEEDTKAIASIINLYQPNYQIPKDKAVIDVSDLTNETLQSLRHFFIERLARMNIQYPH
ncbi:hypothetical protein TVAG_048990 [Trichomonas vaginalis G3]|uniref:Bromo domain-containing protein n=1 Tax=Trichomonas vaginalis (strain ATCC PRA-98 / G3) TaxID=412133 RepID=A2G1W6_TRIV3|nr:bromodomain family [Trichomonas vaginalis G3]EAX88845.1 hypothetical protein TVAG_048990 [Trichomonas vaginalis G3]KAI5515531.1 bromodomain family [Trichomonas vaginalis G3]|eukprot:XP_001301775.1 hypothetical protein [Trichomonas vaginalis G3]